MSNDKAILLSKFRRVTKRMAHLCSQSAPPASVITEITHEVGRLEEMEDIFDRLTTLLGSGTSATAGPPPELVEIEKSFEIYRANIFKLKEQYSSHYLRTFKIDKPASDENSVKLPTISLPCYSGEDVTAWVGYESMFQALVIDNKSLCDIKRLHYLRASLTGDALKVIEHLPLTGDNFNVAWKELKTRFANMRHIATAHYKRIANACVENTSSHSLTKFVTSVSDGVNALNALHFPTNEWSFLLMNIILDKLDVQTRRHFEMSNCTDIPTYDDLMAYLRKRAQALEASAPLARPTSHTLQSAGTRKSSHTSGVNTHSTHPGTITMLNTESPRSCPMCTQSTHTLSKCPDFIALSSVERYNKAKQLHVCFNCLATQHSIKKCISKYACRTCSSKSHHTLLHFDRPSTTVQGTAGVPIQSTNVYPTVSTPQAVNALSTHTMETNPQPSNVLLATVLLNVRDSQGCCHNARALVDTGSQCSFIVNSFAETLRLRRRPNSVSVHGISDLSLDVDHGAVDFSIAPLSGHPVLKMTALCIPKITGDLPNTPLPVALWNHVVGLPLADPSFAIPAPISILLGADVLQQVLVGGLKNGPPGSPIALETIFGWALMGPTFLPDFPLRNPKVHALHITLDDIVQRFWKVEEPPEQNIVKPHDEICEKYFTDNVSRDSTGRYSIALPFKTQPPNLGSSRDIATKRFHSLERKFSHNELYKRDYVEFIDNYLKKGYMRLCTDATLNSYFLPHHAVLKDSTTTKLRVVFDASCRSDNGMSLNDCLHSGPKLQKNIVDIISLFRLNAVAVIADIKQMFLQINVLESDRNYQKILWRSNETEPICEYTLTTVTFGVTSSPYLAIRTLIQLANDESSKYPLAALALLNSTYIDDVLAGADTIDGARVLVKQLNALLECGGFELRKWASNFDKCIDNIPAEYKQTKDYSFNIDNHTYLKVLGLQWDPTSDCFSYKVNHTKLVPTKRGILSDISRIYDPMGWIAPLVFLSKLIIQKLWSLKIGWDDSIPQDLLKQWISIKNELCILSQISLPRHVPSTENAVRELHGFSDSSLSGFAAVIYLRVVKHGEVSTHLLLAKSKVAPLKPISLPRLELCGCVLLCQLMSYAVKLFSQKFHIDKVRCYSDSTIALHWIRSHPSRWKMFVSNRVSLIQEHTSPDEWRHVRSEHNASDCASRGLTPSQLVAHVQWWNGPSFLLHLNSECDLSEPPLLVPEDDGVLETKSVPLTLLATEHDSTLLDRVSTLTKLKRVTVYCLRFGSPKSRQLMKSSPMLTTIELENALHIWLKIIQAKHFSEDISRIKANKPPSKSLKRLSPFIDENGLLRVGGRLQAAHIKSQQQHPVLVPHNSPLTKLIVRHFHVNFGHPGPNALMSLLQRNFWIISARRVIRSVVFRCSNCYRLRPKLSAPPMGELPVVRVQQIKPFFKTGMDYAGPFNIKSSNLRNSPRSKCYICVFVCMTTKACHLELVSELTTQAFLAALQRFISRRGRCSDLYSDHGTNFVGADKELRQLIRSQSTDPTVTNFCSTLNIQFHFIPPHAPHFGGLWEALVKGVKVHLSRIIGAQLLTFEEFYTVLTKVEACLNSRPLTALSPDPNELTALTPGHFLTMEPLNALPEPNVAHTNPNRLKRWQLVQSLHQSFWNRWHKEYLSTLQSRPKWHKPYENLSEGMLVVLKEDNLPPLSWPLGRIVSTTAGPDNVVRVVEVRTGNGVYKRPVVKVAPLPYIKD